MLRSAKSKILAASALGLALAVAGLAYAQQVNPAPAGVAAKADNFRLVSADGFAHDLYRLKDAPAVVLIAYQVGDKDFAKNASALKTLSETYKAKGVEFRLIDSNPADTRDAMLAET